MQAFGFADIEDSVVFPEHPIHAWLFRQARQIVFNDIDAALAGRGTRRVRHARYLGGHGVKA